MRRRWTSAEFFSCLLSCRCVDQLQELGTLRKTGLAGSYALGHETVEATPDVPENFKQNPRLSHSGREYPGESRNTGVHDQQRLQVVDGLILPSALDHPLSSSTGAGVRGSPELVLLPERQDVAGHGFRGAFAVIGPNQVVISRKLSLRSVSQFRSPRARP